MELDQIAAVMAAMFAAALVKGVTGLGFSTTALPLLAFIVGLKAALPLVLAPSLASNVFVMVQAGRFGEMLGRFWPLYAAGLVGVAAGLWLLAGVDGTFAAGLLGVVLIGYAAAVWGRPPPALDPRWARPLAPLVGLATGVVNGLTGSQVIPVLPYLMALRLDPDRFVQAINISFTLASLAMAAGLARLGLLTWETALLSLACLLPVALGVRLGGRLRARLAPERFRRAVLALLAVSGLALIARAIS